LLDAAFLDVFLQTDNRATLSQNYLTPGLYAAGIVSLHDRISAIAMRRKFK
jgi:hypothetical protein